MLAGCVHSSGSRGESCLCLSQLLEDAYIFWLMAPSISQVSNSRLSCSHTAPLILTLLSPSSTLKGHSGLYEEQLTAWWVGYTGAASTDAYG